MLRLLIVLLISIFVVFSCNQKQLESGIDKTNFDTSVKPQDDFYQYVNGTWLKNNEIPADKSAYGAFYMLAEKAEKDLREIIESTAKLETEAGSDEQKVGDFYRSYMDSTLTEELGLKPLEDELARIDAVNNRSELVSLFAHFEVSGIAKPFGLFIDQDLKQSDKYITYLNQGGLGLPDRDYYLNDDEKFKDIRTKYVDYIKNLFEISNTENAAKKSKRIMEIETEIAKKTLVKS